MPTPGVLSRVLRGPIAPRTFRRIAIAAMAGLIFILPSGGLVRLTGSGLGCPDWPGCHGGLVPPMQGHTVIEYSNRLASAAVVALAVIAYLAARRVIATTRGLRRSALTAALASVGQAPLGGLTVMFDLHPLFVAAHFLLSLVALTGGVLSVMIARDIVNGTARVRDRTRAILAGGMLAFLTLVVVSGVLVTASGPHPGDPKVKIRFGRLADAAAIHVRMVIVFVIVGIAFAIWLRRGGISEPLLRRLVLVFAPLLALQIGVGEYQYRNQLPWQVILVHITIVALLYAIALAITWLVSRPLAQEATQPVAVPGPRESEPAATVARQAVNTEPA